MRAALLCATLALLAAPARAQESSLVHVYLNGSHLFQCSEHNWVLYSGRGAHLSSPFAVRVHELAADLFWQDAHGEPAWSAEYNALNYTKSEAGRPLWADGFQRLDYPLRLRAKMLALERAPGQHLGPADRYLSVRYDLRAPGWRVLAGQRVQAAEVSVAAHPSSLLAYHDAASLERLRPEFAYAYYSEPASVQRLFALDGLDVMWQADPAHQFLMVTPSERMAPVRLDYRRDIADQLLAGLQAWAPPAVPAASLAASRARLAAALVAARSRLAALSAALQ